MNFFWCLVNYWNVYGMCDADNDASLFGLQKIYYKQLLEKNYIRDLPPKSIENCLQMEHSYSRDWRPMDGAQVMTTRTILVHRPPQCPSCHVAAIDEIRVDMSDQNSPPIPQYNEEAAKLAMEECEKLAINATKNGRSDDDDWERRINKFGWSVQQAKLFVRVAEILDMDQLSRLAHKEKNHEAVQRRATVDKSVSRIRQALASVAWEPRLTQWLHILLMDNLSPSYLASYLDILQTLRSKVPTLVDKIISGRSISLNHDILTPVWKKPWEPCVVHKGRKLPGQAVIIIAPSTLQQCQSTATGTQLSSRTQRWYNLLATMANVITVEMNISGSVMQKQSFAFISEQMVAACRQKIQETRNETPGRQIILLGFNAGASLALQVGLTEPLSSIVCLGFAFNTLGGIRGEPDDRILELTTPVLFVQGQISQKSSQEEIESLREKMQAQTSFVVVGSADDALRVSKSKRKIEGVTQAMVDNMITDEIYEFASTCILNPPGPRDLAVENAKITNGNIAPNNTGSTVSSTHFVNKRKHSLSDAESCPILPSKLKDARDAKLGHVPRKVGRPRIRPSSPKRAKHALLQQPTTEALNMAIQSIMPVTTQTMTTTTSNTGHFIHQSKEENYGSANILNIESTSRIDSIGTIIPKQKQFSYSNITPAVASSIVGTMTKPKITISTMPKATAASLATQRPLQKVKIISPNQLAQLKQAHLASQPKTFTLKPSTGKITLTTGGMGNSINSGSTTSISGVLQTTQQQQQRQQQQVFTVRTPPTKLDIQTGNKPSAHKIITVKTIPSGTQHLGGNIQLKTQPTGTGSTASPLIISPTKFTIIKPPISNALNFKLATNQQQHQTITVKSNPDLSSTNIFDIPIVFADNDGNIQENAVGTSTTTRIGTTTIDPNVKQLVQNRSIVINNVVQQPIVARSTIINTGTLTTTSTIATNSNPIQNKVMLINRNQVKPVSTILSKSLPPLKYTKVVVSNPNILSTRPKTVLGDRPPLKLNITPINKVDLLTSGLLKQSTTQAIATSVSSTSTTIGKYQPIVINVDSDKTTIKNMITTSVNERQQQMTHLIKPTNTILIKPSGNGGISSGIRSVPILKPGILNRNLTVKRVNLIPQSTAKLLTTVGSGAIGTVSTTGGQISHHQNVILATVAPNNSTTNPKNTSSSANTIIAAVHPDPNATAS